MLSTSEMIMMNTAADWNHHHHHHHNHHSYYCGHDQVNHRHQLIKLSLNAKRPRKTPYHHHPSEQAVISIIPNEQDVIKTEGRKRPTTTTTTTTTEVEENQNQNHHHHPQLVLISSSAAAVRVCIECKTSKTPLWRSGPAGPKTLCNACGIRERKRRRRDVGLLLLKGNNMSIKEEKEVFVEKEDHQQQEAAEAALLLMALSCGVGSGDLCVQS